MNPTDNLRRQHRELVRHARELGAMLADPSLGEQGAAVRARLSSMIGVLTVHLSMEDGVLYPSLLNSRDARVRALAQSYVGEMGGLRATVDAYRKKWSAPSALHDDAPGFVRETRAVLDALSKRIAREESELYPLLDGQV